MSSRLREAFDTRIPCESLAALNPILAALLQNAGALKADTDRLDAVPPLRAALADYAQRFDDPGFVFP